jgi:pyrroloquinoline-quinone synthase
MQVVAKAKAIAARMDFASNPYLRSLRDGSMTIEQFRASQSQFFFAVTFFSRPMAALVGRIDDPKQRLDILHNVVEEHGDFDERFFHHTTFQAFLQSIQVDPAALPALTLWPSVRAFNSVLSTACVLDEQEVGICTMGIIELIFADVSAMIGKAVVDRAWVKSDDLVHYKLHAQIDERHADEFFRVVESRYSDPHKQYLIHQGLELGAYIFDRLYRDLHSAHG